MNLNCVDMHSGVSHVSFGFVDTLFPFRSFLFLEDKFNKGKEFGLQANVFGGSIACMERDAG